MQACVQIRDELLRDCRGDASRRQLDKVGETPVFQRRASEIGGSKQHRNPPSIALDRPRFPA